VREYFQYDPTGEYLKPTSLEGVRLEQGEYVPISPNIVSDQVLSLPSEVLGLDLHLYTDKGFRFYDPISEQILRSYAEAEFERSLERQFRIQAEQRAERLAERLRMLGIDPDI
jgi:hypothetical protein